MRKSLLLFLVVIMAIMYPINVPADAIYGNEFKYKKRDDIIKLERNRFVVEAPDGFIIIRDKPGSKKDMIKYANELFSGGTDNKEYIESIMMYKNGQEFIVDGVFLYRGKYWGVMPEGHHVSYPGWVPMEDLRVIYTGEDFVNEYKDEIYTYSGDKAASLLGKNFVMWEWPGSDREKIVVDDSYAMIGNVSIVSAYKDLKGREWGYVEIQYSDEAYYYYGNVTRNGWICLDDAENDDILAFEPAPAPIKWSPDFQGFEPADKVVAIPTEEMNLPPEEKASSHIRITLMTIGAIVILGVGTLMYVKVFKKLKKDRH